MSHLLIVKRLELYMDLALYKINILLLLLVAVRKRPNSSIHSSHSDGLNVNFGGGSNLAIASKVSRKFSGGR